MTYLGPFTRSLLVAALLLGAAGSLAAQEAASARPSADAITLSAAASYSGATTLDHGGRNLGRASVTFLQIGVRTSTSLGGPYRLGYGLDYARSSLDGDAGVSLPDSLEELALPLSLVGPLAPHWTGRLQLRPGLFSNSLDLASRQLNVPMLALASYRASQDLLWTVGLRYDAWSRYHLLPLAGVNWTFTPGWELAVGLPRTGVVWRFRPDAALLLGATFQGGSYRVTTVPSTSAGAPSLANGKLDYREIRVGAALDLFTNGPASLLLDAGVIVSQRFDYRQPDYRLDGDTAGYVALAGRVRF